MEVRGHGMGVRDVCRVCGHQESMKRRAKPVIPMLVGLMPHLGQVGRLKAIVWTGHSHPRPDILGLLTPE